MQIVDDQTAQDRLHLCDCQNRGTDIEPHRHALGCAYAVWYYQWRDTPPDRRQARVPEPAPATVAADQGEVALCSCLEFIGDDPRCRIHGK